MALYVPTDTCSCPLVDTKKTYNEHVLENPSLFWMMLKTNKLRVIISQPVSNPTHSNFSRLQLKNKEQASFPMEGSNGCISESK